MINFLEKYLNRKLYLEKKQIKLVKNDTEIFKNKYEKYINDIQAGLKNKKEITFLHSGHIGDLINTLPVVKEISKTHTCKLFIQLDLPVPVYYSDHPAGQFFLNKKIYNMLYPLLRKQTYIETIDIFDNQDIDINFDLIRELPINLTFDNTRYGFHIAGVQVDLSEKFLDVDDHAEMKNRISILRSTRYQNNYISYKFLEKFENPIFIGTFDEYKALKKNLKNLDYYECKDFLDMAMIIKNSKVFIGNSSLGIDIAEGLKSPRLLEASPYFPARQVHGSKGYDFYFQAHFEKFFDFFYNQKNN